MRREEYPPNLCSASDDIESIYEPLWAETGANVGTPYENAKGTRCIALGGNDTVGAVKIVPMKHQGSLPREIIVSARQPFVGCIEGEYTVQPIVRSPDIAALIPLGLLGETTLDLRIFEKMPSIRPERGPLIYAETIVGGQGTKFVNVRGRRTIIVGVRLPVPGVGPLDNFQISRLVASDGASVIKTDGRPTTADPGGPALFYQFNTQFNPALVAGQDAIEMSDYISIGSATPGAPAHRVIIQAWD